MCSNPSTMKTHSSDTHNFVASNYITRIIIMNTGEWCPRKGISQGIRTYNPNPGSVIHYLISIKIPYFSTGCTFR